MKWINSLSKPQKNMILQAHELGSVDRGFASPKIIDSLLRIGMLEYNLKFNTYVLTPAGKSVAEQLQANV